MGRQAGNALVLSEPLASRRHCVIEPHGRGFRVRDLGSSNGTFLNGARVRAGEFRPGDVLKVGETELRLVEAGGSGGGTSADAGAASAPAPAAVAEEEVEVLTPGDLVAFNAAQSAAIGDDYEGALLRLADSLADKQFADSEIALYTARGTLAHAAQSAGRGGDAADSVRLLRLILLICFRTHASDIHVEPKEQQALVRVRVDGSMIDLVRLEKAIAGKLTSMIKVLSDIDIAQRGIVQEGHFAAKVPDRRVDFRVSFAPAVYGQKLVVRILDAANAPATAERLGMPQHMLDHILRISEMDAGTLLVCGPTGSGKTTTLYALLRSLDCAERNVVTIEDPVEIQLEGVTQLPVNDEQGNSFASLLRSILRQDPDVILVGEIRDPETAKTALQAAITGHLVFSTVHTRDTMGTLFRLLDLGCEPFMLAQGLNLILAQRLVRQLCPYCKTPVKLPDAKRAAVQAEHPEFRESFGKRGCPRCMGTGFAGRRGLYELLTITPEVRDVILRSPTSSDIFEALTKTGFRRLMQHGYDLVADGVTSLDEVERAVGV